MTTTIPAELRGRGQWVAWRFERRDGKRTKVPYDISTGRRAAVNKPETWASFADASLFAERHADGVGFVFTEQDDFCGVDLDNCIVNGVLHPGAARVVDTLASYTETSPSKTGVKIFVRARLNGSRNRTSQTPWGGEFEAYDRNRFFVVTGESIGVTQVAECQQRLDQLVAELLPPAASNGNPPAARSSGRTDVEVLERAFAAKNGDSVRALYRGDLDGYGSGSEADLALISKLTFWTGPDPDQLDRLFRGSGLMRTKWDRPDYRESTISKALEGAEFYPWQEVTRASESPESPTRATGVGVGDSRPPSLPVGEGGSESPAPVGSPTADSDVESPPFALTLDEFIAAESDSPPALIGDVDDNLLPAHGLLLMIAKGGKGKTTLIIEQAFHLASGVDWHGFAVARPLHVLFIENEGPEDPFRHELRRFRDQWPHELAGSIHIYVEHWGAARLDGNGFVERLNQFVRAHDIDLVVGDPLDTLGMEGVGSPEDTRNMIDRLKRAGLFTTVAWELLHHSKKESAADAIDEASGAWGGRPDSMLLLEKLPGNRARLAFPKVRWSRRGERSAYILSFDPESETYKVVHEEAAEERDYDAEIAALLADGVWRTPKEITATADKGGIGANVDLVKDRLAKRPDRFVSRTGEEAQALGRHPSATVWGLVDGDPEPRQEDLGWE